MPVPGMDATLREPDRDPADLPRPTGNTVRLDSTGAVLERPISATGPRPTFTPPRGAPVPEQPAALPNQGYGQPAAQHYPGTAAPTVVGRIVDSAGRPLPDVNEHVEPPTQAVSQGWASETTVQPPVGHLDQRYDSQPTQLTGFPAQGAPGAAETMVRPAFGADQELTAQQAYQPAAPQTPHWGFQDFPTQGPIGTAGPHEAGPGGDGPTGPPPVAGGSRFDRRRAGLVAAGVVGGFTLLYGGALAYAGDDVAPGTSVRGVQIGGLPAAEAERLLTQRLGPKANQPVTVRVASRQFELEPERVGLAFDAPGTVRAAGQRSLNPVTLFASFFQDRPMDPAFRVDQEALEANIDLLAKEITRPPQHGSISFTAGARPVPAYPRQGLGIDMTEMNTALTRGYLGQGPVSVNLSEVKPKATRAEVDRAMREYARPAVAAPLSVQAEGRTATVPVRVFIQEVTLEADDRGKLVPKADPVKLYSRFGERLDSIQDKAKDATFRISGGRPVVVDSRIGREIQPPDLAKAVLDTLPRRGERVAVVELKETQPKLDSEKARTLGVKESLGSWTTHYTPAPYKNVNIHRAADLIRGTVVLPGEDFSLNKVVGERTAANGFVKGNIISNGRLTEDWGGGTSAVATTVFNAAFFSGVKIREFHPHSFYISIYPKGREATVAWGAKDLVWRNDLDHAVAVDTTYTNSSVTITFWGTKQHEIRADEGPMRNVKQPGERTDNSVSCANQAPQPGFDIEFYRVYTGGPRQGRRETFRAHYQPADKITCTRPPAASAPRKGR